MKQLFLLFTFSLLSYFACSQSKLDTSLILKDPIFKKNGINLTNYKWDSQELNKQINYIYRENDWANSLLIVGLISSAVGGYLIYDGVKRSKNCVEIACVIPVLEYIGGGLLITSSITSIGISIPIFNKLDKYKMNLKQQFP